MRQMLSFTLKSAGHEVIEAEDGLDALDKVRGRKVDVIITDQNMPRMDGLALTRSLRGMAQFSQTPVLILTTESSDEMKQAGRAAGATGWLLKPFDPQRLLDIITKVAG